MLLGSFHIQSNKGEEASSFNHQFVRFGEQGTLDLPKTARCFIVMHFYACWLRHTFYIQGVYGLSIFFSSVSDI